MAPRTKIVIATLADTSRRTQLLRAIDSVLTQGASVLVVINGKRFDPAFRRALEARTDIGVTYVEEASFPNAVAVGRRAVTTPYFGFLDDDDFLLPQSIQIREQYLDQHPHMDVVIANGLREEWKTNPQLFKSPEELAQIETDPLAALLQANWMTPCGALYRTASVPVETFEGLIRYVEWTHIAFRLTCKHRFGFLFTNTFVQSDTLASLSKQPRQAHYHLRLHEVMTTGIKTRRQRTLWHRRLHRLHHELWGNEWADGRPLRGSWHALRALWQGAVYWLRSRLLRLTE